MDLLAAYTDGASMEFGLSATLPTVHRQLECGAIEGGKQTLDRLKEWLAQA